MPYLRFDRSRLALRPLAERTHDYGVASLANLNDPLPDYADDRLTKLAEQIATARLCGSAVILLMGAHLIKYGLSRYIIDMLRAGAISCLGINGAGAIHDYELSLIGATSESVARYIRQGEFGLWRETGRLNDLARLAASEGIGLGEMIGRTIWEERLPHRDISILGWAYHREVPVTVHVGIGSDIVHEHPNCDGAALGAASYRDFLIFAEAVNHLEGGVFLNYGTAIMGPEVYLKALSMARNVATQEGREIRHFTTAVFDLHDLGVDIHQERPKSDALYYYRPFKTILVRTVQDGGESFYVRGPHRVTFPHLYREIVSTLAVQR